MKSRSDASEGPFENVSTTHPISLKPRASGAWYRSHGPGPRCLFVPGLSNFSPMAPAFTQEREFFMNAGPAPAIPPFAFGMLPSRKVGGGGRSGSEEQGWGTFIRARRGWVAGFWVLCRSYLACVKDSGDGGPWPLGHVGLLHNRGWGRP